MKNPIMLPKTYPKLIFGNWEACTYCGEPATDRDHVIPFCTLSTHVKYRLDVGPQTRACKNCNSLLSYKTFHSFEARCAYVSGRLRELAREESPKWSQKELDSLEGRLRDYVSGKQEMRKIYENRARWFETPEYYQNIFSLQYDPLLDPNHEKFNPIYHDFFQPTLEALSKL